VSEQNVDAEEWWWFKRGGRLRPYDVRDRGDRYDYCRKLLTKSYLNVFNAWLDKMARDIRARNNGRRSVWRTAEDILGRLDRLGLVDSKTGELRHPFREGIDGASWRSLIGHTVPTREAVDHLAYTLRGCVCVSVGSGNCLWEFLLRCSGVSVECYDASLWCCRFLRDVNLFRVKPDCVPAAVSRADALLLFWPEPHVALETNGVVVYDHTGYDAWCLQRFRGRFVIAVAYDHKHRKRKPHCTVGSDALWTALDDRPT
jgi:hypothetical protein